MKKNWKLIGALLITISTLGTSCSSSIPSEEGPITPPEENPETPPEVNDPLKVVDKVLMTGEDIIYSGAESRTNLTLGENKLVFTWADNDQIGVVPMEGSQIFFKVNAGVGTKHAKFDGGAWALRADATYAAYFPYRKENTDRYKSEIKFSYLGQKQTEDASLSHMGNYDLMAANPTTAVENEVNFKFKHVNSVGIFRLHVPVEDSFTSFHLRCNKPLIHTTANLDFSGSEVVYSFMDPTYDLKMDLENIASTSTKKEIVLYMMLPPMDFSLDDIMVVLHSKQNRTYQGSLPRKRILSGRAYTFVTTMQDVTITSDITSPDFGNGDVEI